jgi:hypothetical protein
MRTTVPSASLKLHLLVFIGMVFSIWLAWTIRARVLEPPLRTNDGPLAPFIVGDAPPSACASATCRLALAVPEPGQVLRSQAVRVLLPQVEVISAPPGTALVPLYPPLLYAMDMDEPRLPFVAVAARPGDRDPTPGDLGPEVVRIETTGPGWVRAGRDWRSGRLVDFAGAGALPAGAPRAFSELRFQPVPTVRWFLTLAER